MSFGSANNINDFKSQNNTKKMHPKAQGDDGKHSDGSFFESEDGADLNEINKFEEEEKSNGGNLIFKRNKSDQA